MRRLLTLFSALVVALSLLGVAVPARAAEPSARQWRADVRAEMGGSLTFLERRAARGGRLSLAVNLDIDNTMVATHYAEGRPVRPVLTFARRAQTLGMKVFVNSARERGRRAETLAELADAGYEIDGLCLRRPHESTPSSKVRCRQRFASRGFRLVANVGNNRTDFSGGGYQQAYRLPNYDGELS